MSDQEIREVFTMLGIEISPLPEHYNPTDYGRELMRSDHGTVGVSYSDRVVTDAEDSTLKAVYS